MASQAEYVQRLNYHFLLALRDAAVRDLTQACIDFRCDKALAEFIRDVPLLDIERVGQTSEILFKPTFDAQTFERLASVDDVASRGLYALLATSEA